MAKIAYILLCHKDPLAIVAQARRLIAAGDSVAIHFDARARRDDFQTIHSALKDHPSVAFARRRIPCGWGSWSLVEATLLALHAAIDRFPRATHFYMLSGDCMPIKSAQYVRDFLDGDDCDYIESVDFFESGWIKTGFKEERLIYRHWFNERTHKRLFYASCDLQRRFGLKRAIPPDLQIMIGSQWWCLRRRTVEWILSFLADRPDVIRFFRTTWIPDETFFQTLVRHVVPDAQIRNRSLTFLVFSDYGIPVTFYNDHYDLLLGQNDLFARKISPEATALKKRLGDLYAARDVPFHISNEGRKLHGFLTGRGREGRRFAARFWESESSLGRNRELLVVICKKWHVAKRLVDRIGRQTGLPTLDYLFDEEGTPMPDLGGIHKTMEKRTRHRRALLRMLFDYYQTDRLVVCLDPANLDLLADLDRDRSVTRMLVVRCAFSDDYLLGHARRVGLAGERTPPATLATLLPTIRADVRHEADALGDAGFAHLVRYDEAADVATNAAALRAFLSLPTAAAHAIAQPGHLFDD